MTAILGAMMAACQPRVWSNFLGSGSFQAGVASFNITSVPFSSNIRGDRILVTSVHARGVSKGVLSSASIGGVAAGILAQTPSDFLNCALVSAVVPAGTSGTLSFTFSQARNAVAYGLWEVFGTGASASASSAGNNTSATGSVSLSAAIPYNGGIIAAASFASSTAAAIGAVTLSAGPPADFERQAGVPPSAGQRHAGGSVRVVAPAPSATVTASSASGDEGKLIYASFAPR